jgi:hypothetical protein
MASKYLEGGLLEGMLKRGEKKENFRIADPNY